MRQSLRLRLLVAFLAVAVLAVVLEAAAASRRTSSEFEQYLNRNAEATLRSITSVLEQVIADDGLDGAREFLDQAAEFSRRPLQLEDESGELIYLALPPEQSSAGETGGQRQGPGQHRREGPPIRFQLRGTGESLSVALLMPEAGRGGNPNWAPPMPAQGMFPAPLTASGPDASDEQLFQGSVRQGFWIGALLAVVAAGALSVGLSHHILQPVEALTTAARRVQSGDLSQRVPVDSEDEIGRLGMAFNAMAGGLEKQEWLRRNMVSDIAHELRTPLSNIRGYLEAMQDGVVEMESAAIDSLHEEAMLLNHLIDDLQELSLAEAGQLRLDPRPGNVTEMVEAAIASHQMMAGTQGVSLKHVSAASPVPPVEVDPERIGQVLRNLIHNAITYTPSGGEVCMQVEVAADHVRISVSDTGPGIPPEALPYVFDRFYRADRSRARRTGGSGLGLAICKALVEMHGGSITVESQPGQGATFAFTLPVS